MRKQLHRWDPLAIVSIAPGDREGAGEVSLYETEWVRKWAPGTWWVRTVAEHSFAEVTMPLRYWLHAAALMLIHSHCCSHADTLTLLLSRCCSHDDTVMLLLSCRYTHASALTLLLSCRYTHASALMLLLSCRYTHASALTLLLIILHPTLKMHW